MENQIRYTLGKNERLKSRKAIEHLFASGRSFSIFPLRVVYTFHTSPVAEHGKIQAGFTVSTKYFKKATDRNRIRRLIREAYRLRKPDLNMPDGLQLHVFFLYNGNEIPAYQLIADKMIKVIEKLQRLSHEQDPADT